MYYPGLERKNVLLIGGHSNLGQHVTQLFAEAGANVVIGARDVTRAQEVATEARKFKKGEIVVAEVDATNWDSVKGAVERVLEFGSLDVVYHGFGWDVFGSFLELDPKHWDALYEINFRSVMIAYKIVLPIMVAQNGGSIVTMSSVMGRRPISFEPVYGALKCGLIHLAQTLAHDVGKYGVRINVVAPGPTPPRDLNSLSANSNFHDFMRHRDEFEVLGNRLSEEIPLRRLGEPENVAHTVLFLASPVTGAYQTGQVIGVDGGWYMPR
jgi:NAD(P)-dependent dehydrogenase (short-subunit alcohol dehydrogenase family)